MNEHAICSAWRIRRGNDIGTFGEKRRKLEVVQTGVMSVRNRISTCCTMLFEHSPSAHRGKFPLWAQPNSPSKIRGGRERWSPFTHYVISATLLLVTNSRCVVIAGVLVKRQREIGDTRNLACYYQGIILWKKLVFFQMSSNSLASIRANDSVFSRSS